VGAVFLVMALSRGKAGVVAAITNALAPVLTIVLSLVVKQTLPTTWGTVGIVLALGGSTQMVDADEKREETPSRGFPRHRRQARRPRSPVVGSRRARTGPT